MRSCNRGRTPLRILYEGPHGWLPELRRRLLSFTLPVPVNSRTALDHRSDGILATYPGTHATFSHRRSKSPFRRSSRSTSTVPGQFEAPSGSRYYIITKKRVLISADGNPTILVIIAAAILGDAPPRSTVRRLQLLQQ